MSSRESGRQLSVTEVMRFTLSPAYAGSDLSFYSILGFAALHPRLYAVACSAGLKVVGYNKKGGFHMRSDIVPGAVFPDYELPDHTAKRRKLSELQGQDPMVLVLSRGGFCPKDRRQAEGLVQLHRELEVAYCRLVTISTDNITETNEYRTGVGAHWPFLSDAGRKVQKDLDIAEYTDPVHNPMIPHTIVLEPGLVIYKIYNGYWFFGRPTMEELRQDLRAVTQEMPAGLGHHNTRTQSGVAARPQGTLLSIRQNVRPNSR